MASREEYGIEDLKAFAMDTIKGAGEMALSLYGKGDPQKSFDENLITKTEVGLREFFSNELLSRFPNHKLLETASNEHAYSHRESRYVWIFDALDGIANFQAGIPVWGISIALLENFWPVLGVFYMPVTGDMFHAQAGGQSFRGDQKIGVSPRNVIDSESLLLTYSRFNQHYTSSFPGKIRDFGCTGAHINYVAGGTAEAAIIANESFRGLAAASIILEAAGGRIYRMDGNRLFLNEYLDGKRIEEHFLVTPPDMYSQVRNCIHEHESDSSS